MRPSEGAMQATTAAVPLDLGNPYVGPQSLGGQRQAFGRDREIRDVVNLLLSQRIVLLHSPSGAGKTSLLKGGVIEEMRQQGFLVLPEIRLGLPDDSVDSANGNLFLWNTIRSIQANETDDSVAWRVARGTFPLRAYFEEWRAQRGIEDDQPALLVFDQFEEVFQDVARESSARAFFHDLGNALKDRRLWAVFAMRDEYVGTLESFTASFPGRIAARYRLLPLRPEAAREAIVRPAAQHGVRFEDGLLEEILADLRRIRTMKADRSGQDQLGPSVEGVQLQVVCFNAWEQWVKAVAGQDVTEPVIRKHHLGGKTGVDAALADFYAARVGEVSLRTQHPERAIRDWIAAALISRGGFRNQVICDIAQSDGLPKQVQDELVSAHLLRYEQRRHLTWIELAHDRLIQPIREDNRRWNAEHESPLAAYAHQWKQHAERAEYLLNAVVLQDFERSGWDREELTETEKELLARSEKAERERRDRKRKVIVLLIIFLFGLAALVVMAIRWKRTADEYWRTAWDLADAQTEITARSYSEIPREVVDLDSMGVRPSIRYRPVPWPGETFTDDDVVGEARRAREALQAALRSGTRVKGTIQVWNAALPSEAARLLVELGAAASAPRAEPGSPPPNAIVIGDSISISELRNVAYALAAAGAPLRRIRREAHPAPDSPPYLGPADHEIFLSYDPALEDWAPVTVEQLQKLCIPGAGESPEACPYGQHLIGSGAAVVPE